MSVLVAWVLDVVLGEPPARAHPVVWTGRFLNRVAPRVPASPRRRAVSSGGSAWLVGAAAAAAVGWAIDGAAQRLPGPARDVVLGVGLWPLLSGRMLVTEVAAVERALSVSLGDGRERVARIVSRDTSDLTEPEVCAAAIESLAENVCDSLVAVLFWYLVGGLPAAAVYRFANTADACWGYRSTRWRHAGSVPARADDFLNLVPARLTAALLLSCSPRAALPSSWRALRWLPREAGRTESPNAGWPMAATALGLGLRLGKRGSYQLNPAGQVPGRRDVHRALAQARRAATTAIVLAAVTEEMTAIQRGGRR